MALQFHPDKNKAPGAAEAFKAIGNAFAVSIAFNEANSGNYISSINIYTTSLVNSK